MSKKHNPDKARKHMAKADALFEKGKFDKALREYRKAEEFDPTLEGIYDKLNQAHDRTGRKWKMEDFAESVTWTMEHQAQGNPPIRQLHAQLTPEWHRASELAFRILASQGKEEIGAKIEELVGMGEIATRALIGILMDLKNKSLEPEPAPDKPEAER